MPFTGVLDYNETLEGSNCGDYFAAQGSDGKFYTMANHDQAPSSARARIIGCVDTNTTYQFINTEADFVADVAALGLTVSGTISQGKGVMIPGTNLALILGASNPGGTYHTYWIFYEIIDGATMTPVAGGHKVCGPSPLNGRNELGCVIQFFVSISEHNIRGSSREINGNVHLVMRTGSDHFFGASSYAVFFVTLPTTGIHVDLTVGSWNDHLIAMTGFSDGFLGIAGSPARQNEQRAGIYDIGDAQHIGVLLYLGHYEGIADGASGAIMYHTTVDLVGQTTDGKNDVSALFGIPFADTLYNFAGTLTNSPYDDYFSPMVNPLGGNVDLFMLRPYTDEDEIAQYRFFRIPAGGVIDDLIRGTTGQGELIDKPISLNPTIQGVYALQVGSTLELMMRGDEAYMFGSLGAYPVISSLSRRWLAEAGPIRSAS